MTGEVALKACACPLCGDPMRVKAGLVQHVEQGSCLLGTFAFPAEALDRWNTRSPVCEDARAELVEEAAKIAETVSEQAGSYRQDSCLEELGDSIAAEIRALASKPLPPTDDVRAEALRAASEEFRENMDVNANRLGGLSPDDPDYQDADTEIERNRVLAEMCEAALSAQSPPPLSSGAAEAVARMRRALESIKQLQYRAGATVGQAAQIAAEILSPKADGGDHG